MSRWFRHYAGMMRDEKLVGVALRSKQPVERVVWVWGAILENAAEINDGGRYDIDASEVAYFLRADEADIRAVLDALTAANRLADGVVVNWRSRQFQSDRSASRQAAYRERKRTGDGGLDHNETSGDGEVTASLRHSDAPETETETETELEADKEPSPLPSPIESKSSFFGEAKCEKTRKPRNGAVSRKAGGLVYVIKGSTEWEAYAADFRAARGEEPNTNPDGGRWFKLLGEEMSHVKHNESG